jgi:isoleucyl-tRNA synthetase
VAEVAVLFHPAQGQKCDRCWKVLPDVGTHKHPGTCQRCSDALG